MNNLIIRQAKPIPTLVFVMESIEGNHDPKGIEACNLFKGRELTVQFGDGIGQHLAVPRILRRFQLAGEVAAGKKQALALAVALPLLGRELGTGRLVPLRHLGLLLLD
jgi:hypothetical protein